MITCQCAEAMPTYAPQSSYLTPIPSANIERGVAPLDSLQDRVIMGLETRDFDDTGKPRKGKGPDALDHGCDSTEYATFHIIQSIQGFDKILDVLRATFHRSN